jgi:hypothetical protein
MLKNQNCFFLLILKKQLNLSFFRHGTYLLLKITEYENKLFKYLLILQVENADKKYTEKTFETQLKFLICQVRKTIR